MIANRQDFKIPILLLLFGALVSNAGNFKGSVMKKNIFLLLIWALLLWILFLAIPDFYQRFYLKDLGLLLIRGVGFILPLPRGDQDWFYGLFLVFTLTYLEALMIVSAIYFLFKAVWPVIRYLWRELVKPKE